VRKTLTFGMICLLLFSSLPSTSLGVSWFLSGAKSILLLFGKGFIEGSAQKLGEAVVERYLIDRYTHPQPSEATRAYRTTTGKTLRYEFLGKRDGKFAYQVTYGGVDFWCEDSALDDYSKYYLGCPGY
jgi:hypothetical protein